MSLFAQCSNIFIYLFLSLIFSQTWLRYKSEIGLSVSSVCRLWRACTCTLLVGFNFSGIFLHHIVAWPSGKLTHQNHKDRLRGSSPTGVLNARGRKKLQFPTAIARKRLKIDIDGYRIYAAMRLTSIKSFFHPCNIYRDYPMGVSRGGQNVQKVTFGYLFSWWLYCYMSINFWNQLWVGRRAVHSNRSPPIHTVGSRRCRCHL